MTRKRGMVLAAGIVAALLVFVGCYCWYWAYHPHIYILGPFTAIQRQTEGDLRETIQVATSEHFGIPMADSVEEQVLALGEWNDRVITELYACAAPCSVRVSGEVKDGKTTLRYAGYVTTPEGGTTDFLREQTFDLPVRESEFQYIPPLS